MKLSLNWLKSLIPFSMSSEELAGALTMAGLEVEAVDRPFAYLDEVLVGEISDISPHPDADRLQICKVKVKEEVFDVVCGAGNIKNGMKAPFAKAGTKMPDGTTLKKGKIRGSLSEGMLCSAKELNLDNDHLGIMVLPPESKTGTPVAEALELEDKIFNIGLTPNRVDCASVMGLAREVAALENSTFIPPELKDLEEDNQSGHIDEHIKIEVEDKENCPRYAVRLLLDVKVGPSPLWLKNRLTAVGLRSINNIVDITNLVMLETGQPLHAFDLDKLEGRKIVVRRARDKESIISLDEKKRLLDKDMLAICDAEKPVAIAGVMGGEESGVEEGTTRILLESACFKASSVRKTAKKLALSTDASYRFERGVDSEGCIYALNKVAGLVQELGRGRLVKGLIDINSSNFNPEEIRVKADFINARTGLNLSADKMAELLEKIGFSVKVDSEELFVKPPSFRMDIAIKEDISEEVARLFGYDNIEVSFPKIPAQVKKGSEKTDFRNELQDKLCGLGFNEIISYSFISEDYAKKMRLKEDHPLASSIRLKNPISEDLVLMRTSLVPGLLSTLSYNIAQQEKNLKIFETAKIFLPRPDEKLPEEKEVVAFAWTGAGIRSSWYTKSQECDFFDLKGSLESLLALLHIDQPSFNILEEEELIPWARRGSTALIKSGKRQLGHIYEVHPESCSLFDIKQRVFMAELEMEALFESKKEIKFTDNISKFPSTSRDISLILDKTVRAGDVLIEAENKKPDILEEVKIQDLYEGDNIEEGKKSLTLRMTYRSYTETLADKKVNKIQEKITKKLLEHFKASLQA